MTLATGQITIVSYSDAPQISFYLAANKPLIQVYDNETKTYSQNFEESNLIITPYCYSGNSQITIPNDKVSYSMSANVGNKSGKTLVVKKNLKETGSVTIKATLSNLTADDGYVYPSMMATITIDYVESGANGAPGEKGADGTTIAYGIYSRDGNNIFSDGNRENPIYVVPYFYVDGENEISYTKDDNSLIISASSEEVVFDWYTIPSITNKSEFTNNGLAEIDNSDVDSALTLTCEFTYDGKKYYDSLPVYDKTDPIVCSIDSSNGEIFKNGSISTTLTCNLYNSQGVISTDSSYSYEWKKYDSTGKEVEFSKAKNENNVSIESTDIDSKATFNCTVKKGDNVLASAQKTIIDTTDVTHSIKTDRNVFTASQKDDITLSIEFIANGNDESDNVEGIEWSIYPTQSSFTNGSAKSQVISRDYIASAATVSVSYTYNGIEYHDSIPIYDKADDLQAKITSTGGNIFKDGNGETVLTCNLYENNVAIDTTSEYTYKWTKTNNKGNTVVFYGEKKPDDISSDVTIPTVGVKEIYGESIYLTSRNVDGVNTFTCTVIKSENNAAVAQYTISDITDTEVIREFYIYSASNPGKTVKNEETEENEVTTTLEGVTIIFNKTGDNATIYGLKKLASLSGEYTLNDEGFYTSYTWKFNEQLEEDENRVPIGWNKYKFSIYFYRDDTYYVGQLYEDRSYSRLADAIYDITTVQEDVKKNLDDISTTTELLTNTMWWGYGNGKPTDTSATSGGYLYLSDSTKYYNGDVYAARISNNGYAITQIKSDKTDKEIASFSANGLAFPVYGIYQSEEYGLTFKPI